MLLPSSEGAENVDARVRVSNAWEILQGNLWSDSAPFYFLAQKHRLSLRMALVVLACNYICNLNIIRKLRCFDVCLWSVEHCVVGYM